MWLKDYVYIPLGGSRRGKMRTYWNILITFLVSGIWHGANWTFIVWGVLHGLFQIVERAFGLQKSNSKGFVRVGRILATFLLVNFAWIVFRMPNIADAWLFMERIFIDFNSLPSWQGGKMNLLLSLLFYWLHVWLIALTSLRPITMCWRQADTGWSVGLLT